MDYEQDYVMRMIKDMVRALALLIFGKRDIRYEIPEENARTEEDDLYTRFFRWQTGEKSMRQRISCLQNFQKNHQIMLLWQPISISILQNTAMNFWKNTIIAEMKFWKVWKVLPGNMVFWTEIFVWRFRKGGFGT